jgi:hypothetical protein
MAQMTEVVVLFPGCAACKINGNCARGSFVSHPTVGAAILTCFHGPVQAWSTCTCSARPRIRVNYDDVDVICPIEERDVAWLGAPSTLLGPRNVATSAPSPGTVVSILLVSGTVDATVIGIESRHGNSSAPYELSLSTKFCVGDSGSPVLLPSGEVIAVVRNTLGRVGFAAEGPSLTP